MAGFSIESNLDAFAEKVFGTLGKQLPFALSRAVNDTAKDVLGMVPGLMEEVFDRPTPYAKGAFMVYPSDKTTLTATVKRKPDAERRRFLETEAAGGPRPLTGAEHRMDQLAEEAITRSGGGDVTELIHGSLGSLFAIPTAAARKDQYGNWQSGQRNQVFSDLRITRDQNSYSTPASRRKAGRPNTVYFVPKSSASQPGVYQRQGKTIRMILMFTAAVPTYTRRFPFQERAADTAKASFAVHFGARFAEAVASAR